MGAVVAMLNEYFAVLTEAAYQHDGTIFNMAGDSLLVGFNVPFPQPDAAERAWRTALDMVARFEPVAAAWQARHGLAVGVGIGMCAGEAIIGNVGSTHYASYTIIGNPVNTAARLMQMAAGGRSVDVRAPVSSASGTWCRPGGWQVRGDVTLRGKSESIRVFAVSAGAQEHA